MEFYQSIAEYYDMIFTNTKGKANFVQHFLEQNSYRLLDIGCSTGKMNLELASSFRHITAIDLDEAMIEYAKRFHNHSAIEFLAMDMLDIKKNFAEKKFDIISCFGNTLVHLSTISEIQDMFAQVNNLLTDGGSFLCQIINYDRILDRNVTFLPTIENDQIKFVRDYEYVQSKHKIEFATELAIKDKNISISNKIDLIPLRRNEIVNMLKETGFANIEIFSDWKRTPFDIEGTPLILRCRNKDV